MSDQPEHLPATQVRISDDDRHVVIDQLQNATGAGRLTLLEFEDRARQVYAARFSSDLEPITADLPAVRTETIAEAGKLRRRWFVSVAGGNERSGSWDPGDRSMAITLMAGQDLDLTQVAATEVSIFAFTLMGGIDIIVPDGAKVDMRGFMIFGGSSCDPLRSGSSPMRVRVLALGGMGACEVRNLNDKERAKRGLL